MNKKEEALVITMEECGELVQACSKIIRHTTTENTFKKEKWLTNLNEEAGDVLAMIDILVEQGYLNKTLLKQRKKVKIEKLKKWSNLFNED